MKIPDLNPRYILNDQGERESVIIDIATFDAICELLEDYCDVVEIERHRSEPTIPHEETMKILQEDSEDLRTLRDAKRADGGAPSVSLDDVKRELGLD